MKKVLSFLVIVLIASLFIFSLSSAEWANYAAPQLQYISNAIPGLWDKSKADIQNIMNLFPDYPCEDYGDQLVCVSRYNTHQQNDIYINFFMDDYEEHHDNLWKVTFTIDISAADQSQDLFNILWLDGMIPSHIGSEEEFSYPIVLPLIFTNSSTRMVMYFQPNGTSPEPFYLADYYKK